jgi:riboflavin kinase/FMN adenylyltransferase
MKTVLAIGVFDGVHRGHQRILQKVKQRARALRARPAVLTFDAAPEKVIAPDYAPQSIASLAQKLAWLKAFGIQKVSVARFDKRFAAQSPQAFAKGLLKQRLKAAEVVVGSDFVFGARAAGNAWTLKKLGSELGFKVHVVSPRLYQGRPISSTRIRSALSSGDLKSVAAMLGRPWALSGKVLRGDRLGRKLGYPTANIAPEQEALPLNGVWGGRVRILPEKIWRPMLANLGTRPTLKGREFRVELHLLDFERNLYGKRLEAEFQLFLRPEKRFKNLEALKTQIRLDEVRFRRHWPFTR